MQKLMFVTMLGVATAAAQAQPHAIGVVDYDNPDAPCEHCDPNDALGPPDASQYPVVGYYSLGGLGWIELEMGEPVIDIAGEDLVVWEELTASWDGVPGSVGHLPDESADVFLGFDADNWTLVGQVEQGDRNSLFIDVAGSGMSSATFVKIEDT